MDFDIYHDHGWKDLCATLMYGIVSNFQHGEHKSYDAPGKGPFLKASHGRQIGRVWIFKSHMTINHVLASFSGFFYVISCFFLEKKLWFFYVKTLILCVPILRITYFWSETSFICFKLWIKTVLSNSVLDFFIYHVITIEKHATRQIGEVLKF